MNTNPLPWLTERWASYDALLDAAIPSAAHVAYRAAPTCAATLNTLTSLVGALGNDERPYAVSFGSGGVATYTDLSEKRVTIGSGPLFDADLNGAQRAAVLTGLAYHEVAHIRHTRRVMGALNVAWPKGHADRDLALKASNLADDLYGEAQMARESPGLAQTLPVTLEWVAQQTIPAGTLARKAKGLMFGVAATRYEPWFDWTGAEAGRDWWQAWAERAERAAKPADHVAVVQEAVDRIRAKTDAGEPEPEEPPTTCGPEGPGGDDPGNDGEDEPTEDDDDQPKGKGKGEPTDEPTEDGDDESEDGGSKGDDDGDEDGESKAESGDKPEPGEPTDDESENGEPKRADTVTNSGGGDGTEFGDEDSVFVPMCPSEAAKDKAQDDRVQDAVSEYRQGRREASGDRVYGWNGAYGEGRNVTVKRGRAFTTRGRDVQSDEAVAWISPTVGHTVKGASSGHGTGTKTPRIRPDVSRALASAITSARTGAPVLDTGHRSGSLDRTRLARLGTGDTRVFKSPAAPGPQRIRVAVVLDGSSSMLAQMAVGGGSLETRSTVTAQIGVDLAGAFDSLPFIDAALYVHNVNLSAPTVTLLWQKGEPVAYAADYARIHLDGNWDNFAIRFVADDLVEASKGNERLLIVMVSDGSPGDRDSVRQAVADAARQNVQVLSVSVAPDLGINDQRYMYGDHVVEFVPEPTALARLIAQGIGRALNNK